MSNSDNRRVTEPLRGIATLLDGVQITGRELMPGKWPEAPLARLAMRREMAKLASAAD
jgi:hypothetical protein